MRDSFAWIVVKFCLAAAILLAIFHFTVPFYRQALDYGIGAVAKASNLQSSNVTLAVMPYVSLLALIIALPGKAAREKVKLAVLVLVLFYLVDITFAVLQISLQSTFVKSYYLMSAQDFLNLSLPVVFFYVLYHDKLVVPKSN